MDGLLMDLGMEYMIHILCGTRTGNVLRFMPHFLLWRRNIFVERVTIELSAINLLVVVLHYYFPPSNTPNTPNTKVGVPSKTISMLKMEIPTADEIVKRIQGHRGVQGVIITTKDGTPIRSTMDNTSTVLFVGRLKVLYNLASSMVRDIDPVDRLLFLRIRTSKHEMMLSSNAGDDYMAIVIQNPNEA